MPLLHWSLEPGNSGHSGLWHWPLESLKDRGWRRESLEDGGGSLEDGGGSLEDGGGRREEGGWDLGTGIWPLEMFNNSKSFNCLG